MKRNEKYGVLTGGLAATIVFLISMGMIMNFHSSEPFEATEEIWLPANYKIGGNVQRVDVLLSDIKITSLSVQEYQKRVAENEHTIVWTNTGIVSYITQERGITYIAIERLPRFRGHTSIRTIEMHDPGVFTIDYQTPLWMKGFETVIVLVPSFYLGLGVAMLVAGPIYRWSYKHL